MKYFLLLVLFSCVQTNEQAPQKPTSTPTDNTSLTQNSTVGTSIITRFTPPDGFVRQKQRGFALYLQHLPLKPPETPVYYYNGQKKSNNVHAAVLDVDVGKRDLQQCADAIMRLRAEYLYARKEYGQIHFNFTNGFRCDYSEWMKGKRITVNGNQVKWVQKTPASNTYQDFRNYLTIIFSYAGTLSLEKELKPVAIKDLQIGDVFIQGGSPGHAIIVVDLIINTQTNEKRFLLAQSYMPAQDIHIMKNLTSSQNSPWYSIPANGVLSTPEWTFETTNLKRF